jgi:hypothetical protein
MRGQAGVGDGVRVVRGGCSEDRNDVNVSVERRDRLLDRVLVVSPAAEHQECVRGGVEEI